MKLRANEIERFLKKPDPAVRAILIYGPDSGLVRERSDQLAHTVVDDLRDAFRVADLSDGDLRQDPARLADEAAAISMMGGRRVVRVRGAGDALAKICQSYFADPVGDALILIEAGELGPRSALRKLFEAENLAAALPCYVDDARALEGLIRQTLETAKLAIEPAALEILMSRLGSDRGITRSELDKLVLYMGSDGPRTVSLADVYACSGDTSALEIDRLIDAVATGDLDEVDHAMIKVREADMSPVSVLFSLTRHFTQLHLAASTLEADGNLQAAIKTFRPPVHFSREAAVRRQLSLWNRRRVERALTLLAEADAQCKTTGFPDLSVCGRAALRLAEAARAARR